MYLDYDVLFIIVFFINWLGLFCKYWILVFLIFKWWFVLLYIWCVMVLNK